MPSGISIRNARPEDEDAILACTQDAYAPYIDRIGKRPAPMTTDFKAPIASGQIYVATENDEVLGYIVFFPQGKHILLENVAVHSKAAGRGVGKRLIAACETAAAQAGATSVKLYTNAKMTENLSIYPHLGYHQTGRRTEAGFDRIYFEKRL